MVHGGVIYPHRGDLHDLLFWYCAPCLAWVGVHKGTEKALGELANATLRSVRNKAHREFDPLWKRKMDRHGLSRRKARGCGYQWLAEQLGIAAENCHIALFEEEMCWRTIEICAPYANLVRQLERTSGG